MDLILTRLSGVIQLLDFDGSSFTWASTDVLVLTTTDVDGNTSEFSPASEEIGGPGFSVSATPDGPRENMVLPGDFMLSEAYPNPFNPQTTFTLRVPETGHVAITVHDALGRQVAQLHHGALQGGTTHTFHFDASNLASGTYLLNVVREGAVATRQLVLVK